jgi:phosphosulfolactate phosphohydrolase-like enzyme
VVVVCSGTLEQAAFEDVLAAGALCDQIWAIYGEGDVADSVRLARESYHRHADDLIAGLGSGRNGRCLLNLPELRDDVAFCATRDSHALVPTLETDGWVRWVR